MSAIDPLAIHVSDVMTPTVVPVSPNDALLDADRLAKDERIRHLPVVGDDGQLCGVVSQRDIYHSGLLKMLGYGQHGRDRLLESLRVKEVMVTEVVTTTPDATIAAAARLMHQRKIGCLPVVDGGELVGIITESDMVALLAR